MADRGEAQQGNYELVDKDNNAVVLARNKKLMVIDQLLTNGGGLDVKDQSRGIERHERA
jgi:hypothetical protein